MTGSFDLQDVLFYGGVGFSIMRCMSFALENCDKKDGSYTFFDLLKYNFYLPFFFFGPIMTFDRYHVQVRLQSQIQFEVTSVETKGGHFLVTPFGRTCSMTERLYPAGKQHSAGPQGEGDVEHHHHGLVAPRSYFGRGCLLPLSLYLDNPQRHAAGLQALRLVPG